MIIVNKEELPGSWELPTLDQIAELNPKLDKSEIDDSLAVSFVPMPAVEAENGRIDVSTIKGFSEVKKGYTPFKEKDVLFAKITPCMENGKMAIVPELNNDLGFGSTEFHVFRAYPGISPEFIYYYISSKLFRMEAEHNMTGAVGQRRVPVMWLSQKEIPLPPLNEQHRIVAKIEELFSELDNGIASLKTARQQLKVYRQALLKHAFEGKLSAQWREDHADELETAEQLLTRIQQQRQIRYQQQLEVWQVEVERWQAEGKQGKKPGKPSKLQEMKFLTESEVKQLPEIPESWVWVNYGDLCSVVRNGISKKPVGDVGEKICRISAVRPMFFDMNDYRIIENNKGEFDAYFLQKGDLVFTRYNGSRRYVGVCAEYKSDEGRLFPDKLVQTRADLSCLNSSYLEKALNCGGSRKFIESKIRTTAGQSGVSGGDIKNVPVPISSLAEQIEMSVQLDATLSVLDEQELDIETNLKRAEALRQSILKKAFSGQLVPQDPNDEPASELLQRIQAQKAELAAQAKAAKAVTKKKAAGRKRLKSA